MGENFTSLAILYFLSHNDSYIKVSGRYFYPRVCDLGAENLAVIRDITLRGCFDGKEC